jgi:hypothetical protein
MGAPPAISESQGYGTQLLALVGRSGAQLVRSPSALHRAEAVRLLRRQALWLSAIGIVLIVALMFGFDATEIAMMPPRKSPELWPVQILTDFGKDEYVLALIGAVALVMALAFPLMHGAARTRLLRMGVSVEFLFLAVLVPVLATDGACGHGLCARPWRLCDLAPMAHRHVHLCGCDRFEPSRAARAPPKRRRGGRRGRLTWCVWHALLVRRAAVGLYH